MKTILSPKDFATVCDTLQHAGREVKTATKYLSDKLVIRATWQGKPSARNTRETMLVTYGVPNYLERNFIAACKKAGEPIPVKKVQLKAYPVKKKPKK